MKPIRKPFNITLSPDLREALERYAKQSGRKQSHIIEEVLRQMLKEEGWLNYAPPPPKAEDGPQSHSKRHVA